MAFRPVKTTGLTLYRRSFPRSVRGERLGVQFTVKFEQIDYGGVYYAFDQGDTPYHIMLVETNTDTRT